jgi:hypothetical protein
VSLIKLETAASSYEDINGGAHRKAASLVGVPALVRQIGFWSTPIGSEADQVEPVMGDGARDEKFEAYVASLHHHISSGASPEITFDVDEDHDGIYNSDADVRSGRLSIIWFRWQGLRAVIRIEYHGEFVTLTSILDLSIEPKPFTAVEGRENQQVHLRNIMRKLKRLFDDKVAESRSYLPIAFHQNLVWRDFESEVLIFKKAPGLSPSAAFGPVFADFRGMITGSTIGSPDNPLHSASDHVLQEPFRDCVRRPRTDYLDPPPAVSRWRKESLRRLWPLFESEAYLREFEFTASAFLDGRVIYVSALGPKPSEPLDPGWEWTPVYYYLHSSNTDPWQMGRLVDRIHTLGSFRLASTIGINLLNRAGAFVDELREALNLASRSIQLEMRRLGRDVECWDPPSAAEEGKPAADEVIPSPDEAMAAVEDSYKAMDSRFSRGFRHRLERAQYYIDRFQQEARTLRAKRIEGFQLYDEFVLRRMGGLFRYVALLSNRMSDIDARQRTLGRAYAALKTGEVTCRIDRQNKQIKTIQDFGEAALIGILLPYYAGTMMIEQVLDFENGAEPRWIWPIWMSFFAGLVLLRMFTRRETDREERRRLAKLAIFFSSYILAVWICYAVSPSLPSRAGDGAPARAHAAAPVSRQGSPASAPKASPTARPRRSGSRPDASR